MSKPTQNRDADQRLQDCRRQIIEAIESSQINDRSAAKLLARLADEFNASLAFEPLPSVTPKVYSGNLPQRPKLRGALARLISGA